MQRNRSAVTAAVAAAVMVLAACAAPATDRAAGTGTAGTGTAGTGTAATTDATGSVGAGTTDDTARSFLTVGPTTTAPTGSVASGESSPVDTPAPASTPASTGTPVKATSQPLPGCDPATLKTRTAGELTFATDNPTAPWFTGSTPAFSGGFEAAVAAAVATRLGYSSLSVTWVAAPKAKALAGTATGFDAFIGQAAIPDQPSAAVQYSTGYFDDGAVLLARAGSPLASATSEAQLSHASVAVLTGTTVDPLIAGRTLSGAGAAAAAVRADPKLAVVAPLSEVSALTKGTGLDVVARIPAPAGQTSRQWGLVLPASSTLAPCLSAALDTLRVEGTLAGLADTWLPGADARELTAG